MSSLIFSAREADIAYDADQPSARDKESEAMFPHLIELLQEGFIVFNVTELPRRLSVVFQGPVWRGGENQLNAVRR